MHVLTEVEEKFIQRAQHHRECNRCRDTGLHQGISVKMNAYDHDVSIRFGRTQKLCESYVH